MDRPFYNPGSGILYTRLARAYDVLFKRYTLSRQRRVLATLPIRPGARVLEIGVGTGLALPCYPRDCSVVGIDIAPEMLAVAESRVRRLRLANVSLRLLDAADLVRHFTPASFDCVVAAYVLSVVPDPLAVLRAVREVTAPGGTLVIMNHFASENAWISRIERVISPLTCRIGWRADMKLDGLFDRAGFDIGGVRKLRPHDLVSVVYARPRPGGGNGHGGNGHGGNGHAGNGRDENGKP
ncbi:MAG: methyltransferase domain-containing protein [Planctomycetales bacterium]|nr:methyltransferase domain-containing protein [Planctomycetales bacterium]